MATNRSVEVCGRLWNTPGGVPRRGRTPVPNHLSSESPAASQTIHALVDHWATTTPHAPAISFPTGDATFSALADASRRAAVNLVAAGVGRDDRVAVFAREV